MRLHYLWLLVALLPFVGCATQSRQSALGLVSKTDAEGPALPDFSTAKTAAEVSPFLDDLDPLVRLAAARRLGQFRDASAVPALRRRLEHEPGALVMGTGGPKPAMIVALGKIGGAEAEAAIVDTLRRYLRKGPVVADHIYRDGDYYGVVRACIIVLRNWPQDEHVVALLQTLTDEQNWRGRLDSVLQEAAASSLLAGEMQRTGALTRQAQVRFLLERLTARGGGHKSDWAKPGVKTPEAACNTAAMALLVDAGSEAAPLVQAALRANPPLDVARAEALQAVLNQIRYAPPPETRRAPTPSRD